MNLYLALNLAYLLEKLGSLKTWVSPLLSWQSKCIFPNQKLRFIRFKIV
jgi:hypothetical protein